MNGIRQMLRRLMQGSERGSFGENDRSGPRVSFVLIVYDMPSQAQNTVRSLLPDYQTSVEEQDYEVIVVENKSANTMSREFIDSLPGNFSYHLRNETRPTPIYAANEGIEKAKGENICVMIDGARLLTPGVVKNVLLGHTLSDRAVVTVPGYHLGHELQQKSVESGYGVEQEKVLMDSISWPEVGYRLFDIACFSGSCAPGFYLPHSESNCISMPREIWRSLGGFDAKFDMRGGGLVNLDLYKRACEYPGVTHIFLHGEGTFHQFHGGVTTGGEAADARQVFIDAIKAQYQTIRGQEYQSPVTNVLYLGELPDQALRFVQLSSTRKMERIGAAAEVQYVPD